MPSGFDKTRITKTSIPVVKAIKGDDIWTKVKTKAAESAVMAASSIASNGSHQDNESRSRRQSDSAQADAQYVSQQQQQPAQAGSPQSPQNQSAALGSYPKKEFGTNGEVILAYEDVIEVWSWTPSKIDKSDIVAEETLYLVSRTDKINGSIEMVKPLECDSTKNRYALLVGYKLEGDHYFEVIVLETNLTEKKYNLVLLPSTIGTAPYHCKVLANHFIISTSEGSISLFNKSDYTPVNNQEISCKVINGAPVCDAQGDWFIYNPSPRDPIYEKLVAGTGEYSVTPLHLPKPGPLLNRVLKNLSSTAIDGVFKLAEISHSKLKKYMSQNTDDEVTKSRNLRDTITKILNVLNETSSKQFLILISMRKMEPLFVFSPPGGCSLVSLSPCDSLLATVTLRGDDIFIWDFTKFNTEVSLIEKFKRGKTPGVVDQIIWYTANKYVGVLSRLSGSLHWFQNNFLNEYDESDRWTMSSFGLKNLRLIDDRKILSFDNKNNLKIVETKGFCNTLYALPPKPIPTNLLPDYLFQATTHTATTAPSVGKSVSTTNPSTGTTNPPSATAQKRTAAAHTASSTLELDYTSPYEFFYKNRRVEFFDKSSENIDDWLFKNDNKDLKAIDFGRANGVAVFHDNADSINMLLNE